MMTIVIYNKLDITKKNGFNEFYNMIIMVCLISYGRRTNRQIYLKKKFRIILRSGIQEMINNT